MGAVLPLGFYFENEAAIIAPLCQSRFHYVIRQYIANSIPLQCTCVITSNLVYEYLV